ncbi:MAG: MFS transporter, partial [Lachnospiraceae bacterium]|nr:MFS transporter [Lachnospiraceae bacterium]
QKIFWILMVLMICAGASEHSMSQWASAFAESGLNLPKTVGDLAGPSCFALLMGIARALYGKYSERIPLVLAMRASALLCLFSFAVAAFLRAPVFGLIGCACCGFAVGIFWPGTFSLAAMKLPAAGTAMYALLALGGDVGCSLGPTAVGFVAGHFNGDLHIGFILAMLFPVLILLLTGPFRKKEDRVSG